MNIRSDCMPSMEDMEARMYDAETCSAQNRPVATGRRLFARCPLPHPQRYCLTLLNVRDHASIKPNLKINGDLDENRLVIQ